MICNFKMKKAYIKGISYYLPEFVQTNNQLLSLFPEWSAEKVAEKVGVEIRHIAGDYETAGDMAEQAAKKLFIEYNISPDDIDFVLFCTQSSDYFLPSTSCILQHKLGISNKCGAFDYNLGCSGGIYGLAVAKGLITSGIAQNVLLLTAETYTKYLHPEDKSNRTIFGDGAAACLISTSGLFEIGNFSLGTDGSGSEHLIVRTGASRMREKTGVSFINDEGHMQRDDYLYMNGNAIFNFTLNAVPNMVDDTLRVNDITKENVDYFVFHQANKFMLNTIRKICRIPQNKFYNNIRHTGNTVSSTVFIALKDCLSDGIISSGDKIMIAGFGVGLSYGSCILK